MSLLVDLTGDELSATLNKSIARSMSSEQIETRLEALLLKDPTPWIAIEAVQTIAEESAITIDPALKARIQEAYDAEHGVLQTTGKCLSCGWDAGTCEISATLLCRVPVDLTPIGDVAGVLRESGNYALGREVDEIDLTLSAVGLGATVVAPLTGGSSLSVKLGATALKTGRKLGRISPSMTRLIRQSADETFDWDKLAKAGPQDFPKAVREAVDPDALRPLARTTEALGDLRGQTDTLTALHLMRAIYSAKDAEKAAQISTKLGERTLGAFELVGKSRLFRATLKYSDEALGAFWSAIAALTSLGWLLGSMTLRRLTRKAKAAMTQSRTLPR